MQLQLCAVDVAHHINPQIHALSQKLHLGSHGDPLSMQQSVASGCKGFEPSAACDCDCGSSRPTASSAPAD